MVKSPISVLTGLDVSQLWRTPFSRAQANNVAAAGMAELLFAALC